MDKNQKNKTPLHRRTHWRTLRGIVTEISAYEKINAAAYNLGSGVCYICSGDELKGNNVTFALSKDRSCWVSDNKYEMFEFPKLSNFGNKNNKEYLYLSHNMDYDYWILGTMDVALQKTRKYTIRQTI